MAEEQPKPNQNLSDISHLFLSSIREKQQGNAPRPVRKPPQPKKSTIDLTPEEFAAVFASMEPSPSPSPAAEPLRIPPVSAIIASHLNGKQFDQVKRYARHLASGGQRVGLLEIDIAEFRLMRFDGHHSAATDDAPAETTFRDTRVMADAITEMSCDLDCWLLLISNPKLAEARPLLRETTRWVLLSTADHDGIVSAYRSLKGLADVNRPTLSVALLDARDPQQAQQVHHKLATVCSQFLKWTVEQGQTVADVRDVGEHLVMSCRPMKDKAQLATASHWQVVGEFLSLARSTPAPIPAPEQPAQTQEKPAMNLETQTTATARADCAVYPGSSSSDPEVLELSASDSPDSILGAILQRHGGDMVECPIRPPGFGLGRILVGRDHRLMLLAAPRQGLSDLGAIARAYQWMAENRQLIAMALPQLAIDAAQMPHMRLLLDHSDADAGLLAPLMQSGLVEITTYRRVRWGGRLGLLVEQ